MVQIRLRADNPAFPAYVVMHRGLEIGRQYSVPSLSDCEWIRRTHTTSYACGSAEWSTSDGHLPSRPKR